MVMDIGRHQNEIGLRVIIIHDAGKEVWKCQTPASDLTATKLLEEIVHRVRNWESAGKHDLNKLRKECDDAKTLCLI